MFEHRDADRVPITDYPWGATIERWQREGMPAGVDCASWLGMDRHAGIGADVSPRYESRTLEETDEYIVQTTNWGTTTKTWKHAASTPEFLAHHVVDADTWREAKARMTPSRDRVNWEHLDQNYRRWREEGYWVQANFWFGFDVAHSWMIGTERVLMAMRTDPEWLVEIFNHYLDLCIAQFQMVWDEGYRFDSIGWPDDMGYKYHQFFSVGMYRELLKPVHRRAVEWAHAKGLKAHMHSCGDIRPMIPELVDIGLDGLNPLEVKAGMDPVAIKREFGDKLLLQGGINALLYNDMEALEAQVREVVPKMKENGGYVFSSDHSVPSSISLKDFQHLLALARELGSY
jgi:uroporphyrinogen decarboxylase